MTVLERAAYFKGVIEGLDFDATTKEGKVIKVLCEVIEDLALSVADLEDDFVYLDSKMDEIDEDLGDLEKFIYDLEDDDCDCGCCGDDHYFSVTCPNCDEAIELDPDLLDEEVITCPNCETEIELEFDDDDFEEDEE